MVEARYDLYIYVDRIVVGEQYRRHKRGRLLYDDLIAFAKRHELPAIACEFDIDPPNPASEKFHAGYGFKEVGRQVLYGGQKEVSMQLRAR